jgi:hypothetical protein
MAETQEQINERMARVRAARKTPFERESEPPAADLRELLAWVGQWLRAYNMAGRITDRFCMLCAQPRYRMINGQRQRLSRHNCRHAEIWAAGTKE